MAMATAVTAASVTGLAKVGTDAALSMIKLYHEMVDLKIPWNTYNEAMVGLKDSQRQYSDKAAELVGNLQTLLLDSCDHYRSSRDELTRWCRMAVPVLGKYMSLFTRTIDTPVAEAQKMLLLEVLNEGAIHMDNAIKKLELSSQSFNTAYGELTKLKTQLDNDFSEHTTYFQNAAKKVRAEGYGGAVAGVVGALAGPISLAITLLGAFITATVVVEGHLIPNLKKAFAETRKQFDELLATVQTSKRIILSTKASIEFEVKLVGEMAANIDCTRAFANAWSQAPKEMFEPLKTSTTELIEKCKEYISSTNKLE